MKSVHAWTGWTLALLIAASVVAVACGSGSSSTSTATSTAGESAPTSASTSVATPGAGGGVASPDTRPLCSAIDEFRSSVTDLGSSSSVADLKVNAHAVADAAQKVKMAAQDARISGSDKLQTAIDDFTKSIDDATSSDRPVAQTLVALSSSILKVQDGIDQARETGGC
jgi:hypothetical protein